MRRRWLTIALTLACFVASLLALPLVPRQFFPASDRPELVVDYDAAAERLDLRQRTGRDQTRRDAQGRSRRRELEHLCRTRRDPLLSSTERAAGQRLLFAGGRYRQGCARRGTGCTRCSRKTLAERLPGVVARVSPLELGPPVGWPVQYRVSGPDIEQVRAIACNSARSWARTRNLRLVNFDWIEPSRKVRVRIDQDQARLLGLSSQALSALLNTVMTGTPITQVRDNIYLIDVVTRAQDEQRVSLSTLRALQLPLPNGRTVPLEPGREFRIRSGVSVGLAARARADIDGAGRCRLRRDARGRGAHRWRRRSKSSTPACRRAIASLPAVRSRKARNRRPRSSPCCPRCCS